MDQGGQDGHCRTCVCAGQAADSHRTGRCRTCAGQNYDI